MADDKPDNLVLELLRGIRADVATMRRELHEVKLEVREHTTWLSKLNQGEALILQTMERVHERLDRAEMRLELRDVQ
jgi:hypothetical protein